MRLSKRPPHTHQLIPTLNTSLFLGVEKDKRIRKHRIKDRDAVGSPFNRLLLVSLSLPSRTLQQGIKDISNKCRALRSYRQYPYQFRFQPISRMTIETGTHTRRCFFRLVVELSVSLQYAPYRKKVDLIKLHTILFTSTPPSPSRNKITKNTVDIE